MKKYAINYNRVFPDHRVPIDYHFNRQLMKGPSTYFQFVRDGFNSTAAKHFHVLLSLTSMFAFTAAAFWIYYNHDSANTNIGKKDMPGYKYTVLSNRGGFGAYDTILHKFENEKGGIRDLPWEE